LTFDEAILRLRRAGLVVQQGPGLELVAAADPQPWPGPPTEHDGILAYRFGFSLRHIDGAWFARLSPPTPAEQHAELEQAVTRALELFRSYRSTASPDVYWDQFARFSADAPLPVIERALVSAGWLSPTDRLRALGVEYLSGGTFLLDFRDQARVVLVSAIPEPPDSWRLAVRCYRRAVGAGADPFPVRGHSADGSPIPISRAPQLSFEVASVVHRAVVGVASNVRWAAHQDPDKTEHRAEPIPPPA
jgi:hypothetical protein